MALRTNGASIRALREAHGWKVGKFAIAAHISGSYLCNIEAGRKQASPEVLVRIAALLHVPLAAITSDYRAEDVA